MEGLLHFEIFKDAVAFSPLDGPDITYASFAHDCDTFASRLGGSNQLVLLPMDNSYRAIVALFGILRSGNAALICEYCDTAQQTRLTAQFDPDYVLEGGDLRHRDTTAPRPEIHTDLALVLNTSGSTGSSKCVRQPLSGIVSNAGDIANYLDLRPTDCALLTLPLHYCYGLSVLFSHLSVGARIIPGMNSVVAADFRETLITRKVTHFPAVPYTIEMIERAGFRDWDLPDFRVLTQAGGKLGADLVRRYAGWASTRGKGFFVMYGATEATSRMGYMTSAQALETPDSIGQAIPSGSYEIIDDAGEITKAPLTPGELVYTGPNVMFGYAQSRVDLTRGREVERLHTGDIAERTAEGLYRIVGRASRFSKIYGRRQNLADIEGAIRQLGASECAIVSDDRSLFVSVVGTTTTDAIETLIQDRYQIPAFLITVRHVTDLPRLSSGKVDYPGLTARMQAGHSAPAATRRQDAGAGPLQAQLEAALMQTLGCEIGPGDSFRSLGGDSLSYVQASLSIEQILGTLPQDWENMTPHQLAQTARSRRRRFTLEIETSILVRFFAVILIVSNHSGLSFLSGGALLLMFLAGFNLSRFHFVERPQIAWGKIASNLLVNVLLPFWLFAAAYGFLKHGQVDWTVLALLSFSFNSEAHGFATWFVVALIHATVLASVVALAARRGSGGGLQPLQFLGYALIMGLLIHLYDVYVLHSTPEILPISLYTRWFWLFSLGFLAALVTSRSWRISITVALLVLTVLGSDNLGRQIIPFLGGALCVLVPRVVIFAWLRKPVLWVSGASLFIYMLHGRAPIDTVTADWPVDVLRIGIGLVTGIVAWVLFSKGTDILRRFSARKDMLVHKKA